MEIRGEDFIKKVQLKQEKSEIEQRLNEIRNSESAFSQETQQRPSQSQLDREIEIQEEREYSDIMLGKSSSNTQNKKKYLVLGLILVILFLLTIIIIRLLTNDSASNDSFTNSSDADTQKVVGNENIEEQYQKIINEKLKNIKEEKETPIIEQDNNQNLNLEKMEQKEVVQEEPKVETPKPDVFEVKKEEVAAPAPVKKVVQPKPVVKKAPAPVVKKTTSPTREVVTSKPKGTFVQIGAFSKMPEDKYLNNITSKGFSYKVYKVSINGKMFHKVLIGPYSSRGQAKNATDDIKKKLNVNGAFILTY